MSTAALALLAAVAALIAVAAVAVMVVAPAVPRRPAPTRGLLVIGERMDALARELATTVERVREDALRARIVESFGQALDLDEVLARCAEAAASLDGVAGRSSHIETGRRPALGLGRPRPPRRRNGRARRSGRRAPGRQPGARRRRLLPLPGRWPRADAHAVGHRRASRVGERPPRFLTVFGRDEEPPVAGSDFQTLEAIARHAGPAIEIARRRAATRHVPDADGLTGLGTRQALHETLALEVARATATVVGWRSASSISTISGARRARRSDRGRRLLAEVGGACSARRPVRTISRSGAAATSSP